MYVSMYTCMSVLSFLCRIKDFYDYFIILTICIYDYSCLLAPNNAVLNIEKRTQVVLDGNILSTGSKNLVLFYIVLGLTILQSQSNNSFALFLCSLLKISVCAVVILQ